MEFTSLSVSLALVILSAQDGCHSDLCLTLRLYQSKIHSSCLYQSANSNTVTTVCLPQSKKKTLNNPADFLQWGGLLRECKLETRAEPEHKELPS
jgi:hypothetical protein